MCYNSLFSNSIFGWGGGGGGGGWGQQVGWSMAKEGQIYSDIHISTCSQCLKIIDDFLPMYMHMEVAKYIGGIPIADRRVQRNNSLSLLVATSGMHL